MNDSGITNPMLICVDEDRFYSAKNRILICGQETKDWDPFGKSIEHGIATYKNFFIDEKFYGKYGISSFWKGFRYLKSEICKIYNTEDCVFIYQNLSKMGRFDGVNGVTDGMRKLERNYFPVFRKEMEILNPDIVLFLTGPGRDCDIKFHFPDLELARTDTEPNMKKMAWLEAESLPKITLRMYHPSYYAGFSNNYKQKAIQLISQR